MYLVKNTDIPAIGCCIPRKCAKLDAQITGGIIMTDRPMAAVILLIVGSMFYTLGGVAVARLAPRFAGTPAMQGAIEPNWAAAASMAIGVVCSVAIIAGALLTHTGVRRNMRLGSIISILSGVVGFSNTLGGLWIGLVLVLIGNLLTLRWKQKSISSMENATPALQA